MNAHESAPLGRGETAALVAIALLGLAVHAWFALGADAGDTDRALVVLMARHFARGDGSIYFWQQNYMGALEPLLLTPLAWLGRATPLAAAFVGVALTAALAALSVRLARRLGGLAWLALLFWAVPPAVVVHHHIALYGARLTATLLSLAALSLALRAAHGDEGGADSRSTDRASALWILAGALTGLAYFGDHLMIAWAVGVMWVAARRSALARFALGALPIVALDTVAAVLTPAIHLAGPNDPSSWLTNVPLLLGATLPQLFGLLLGRAPGPLFEPATSLVPSGRLWLVFAAPGAVALAALGVTFARNARALIVDTQASDALGRRTPPQDQTFALGATAPALAVQALLLVCLSTLALFALVGGGGDRWPVRYLVPLWPAVSVLGAIAAARWRPVLRPLAAAAVLPAVFTLSADRSWPRASDVPAARAEAASVRDAVTRSGARAVWADYWDAYRMDLFGAETPPWVTLRIIQRRPDQASAAAAASPVAYLLRRGDREVADSLARAEQRGVIRVLSSQDVGRYRLTLTDRSAPGLVLITSHPTRAWQRLAAAGAGLLFTGALVALAALALLFRWPALSGGETPAAAAPARSTAPDQG